MEYLHKFTLLCILCLHSFTSFATLQTYIVHVESPDRQIFTDSDALNNLYSSFLPPTLSSSNEDQPRIVYSYHNVFKGFSVKLSPEEVKEMEKKEGFISARPEKVMSLHTTHTPSFLGLHRNLGFWNNSNFGKGVIIGVLDGGIFPDHPSFSDVGMPPPPAKWKGSCDLNFTACNNKLIGARSFPSGSNRSVLDIDGHGTHTASTAAGNFVEGANVFGLASGTAVGVAPLAHLAIYKVCSPSCLESSVLAAMDAAIDDGVDILSISLGSLEDSFYDDSIALGAYSAMQRGIFVSCSAGNSGPDDRTLSNEAPWMLTVGASTIDRKQKATAMLGNNEFFDGESGFQPEFPSTMLPLIYPGSRAGTNESDSSARFCSSTSLNNTDLQGKIVLCEVGGGVSRIGKGEAVKDAGGAAMILMNSQSRGYTTSAEAHILPAVHISFEAGEKIRSYVNSTISPRATIVFKGTIIGDVNAPAVASFSSRGPNFVSPGILKPDIVGPGVNILAAWHLSVENKTDTKSNFNVISGTSMSCPHLSGVAALLKSAHPDWSPAAIKSAIMTTADQESLGNRPIDDEWKLQPANIFALGAGHVNPPRANNPGLIYDILPEDYIPYLCGLNYTNQQVGIILKRIVNCSEESSIPEAQLNYPSFSISSSLRPQTYTRTVTNVGDPISTYMVEIVRPAGYDVTVEPTTLFFSKLKQKLTYRLTFTRFSIGVNTTFSEGYLKWISAKYTVRSPIAIIY